MAQLSELRRALIRAQNAYARGRLELLESERFWADFRGIPTDMRDEIIGAAVGLSNAREGLANATPDQSLVDIMAGHGFTVGPDPGRFDPGHASTWEVTVRVTRAGRAPFWFRERGTFAGADSFGSVADYLAAQLDGISGRYPGADVEIVSDIRILY